MMNKAVIHEHKEMVDLRPGIQHFVKLILLKEKLLINKYAAF